MGELHFDKFKEPKRKRKQKQMADDSVFNSGIMLRVGKTEEIERQFNEGYLRFGCAANWIMYAKSQPPGIADKYEAIFAHINKDDPRLSEECHHDAINLAFSYLYEEGPNDTLYVRYTYACLVPAICFYSIDIKDAAKHFGIKGNSNQWLRADLEPYYDAMRINREESSVLIVRFPSLLIKELRNEIPKLIDGKWDIEKSKFDRELPLAVGYVNYDLDLNEMFYDPYPYKALFRKRPEFRDQREARLVIPGVNYLRHPKVRPEEFHDHELKVSVPHLQEYSSIVPATKCKRIQFENFNEDLSRYDILFRDKE